MKLFVMLLLGIFALGTTWYHVGYYFTTLQMKGRGYEVIPIHYGIEQFTVVCVLSIIFAAFIRYRIYKDNIF